MSKVNEGFDAWASEVDRCMAGWGATAVAVCSPGSCLLITSHIYIYLDIYKKDIRNPINEW